MAMRARRTLGHAAVDEVACRRQDVVARTANHLRIDLGEGLPCRLVGLAALHAHATNALALLVRAANDEAKGGTGNVAPPAPGPLPVPSPASW